MSSITAICCSLLTLLPGHVLPDGFVERGVDVLVFPGRVEIHYLLGLSDGQMRKELRHLADEVTVSADSETAWSRFRERMGAAVVEEVVARIDGQRRPLRLLSVEPWVKHHVSLKVVVGTELGAKPGTRSIDVRDELPLSPGTQGLARMALRGRRGVQVVECTGQANLVRAERVPMTSRGADRIPANCRIAAVVRLAAAGESRDEDVAGRPAGHAEMPIELSGSAKAPFSSGRAPPPGEDLPLLPSNSTAAETAGSNGGPRPRLSARTSFCLVAGGAMAIAVGVFLAIRRLKPRS